MRNLRTWGIILSIFGILGVISIQGDKEALKGSLGWSTLVISPGLVLINKGQKVIKKTKLISTEALVHLREKGFIDSIEISDKLKISEISVRRFIYLGQIEAFIPSEVNIK